MRRISKWLFGTVAVLAALLCVAALLVFLVLQNSVSPNNSSVKLAGLQGPVEVVFDREAIPHIAGETHADAARALGFIHARDRLWQMEVLRMAGQGRLSEMFGEATIETDVFLKTLAMDEASRSSYSKLMPETREIVESYVQGINSYISRDTAMFEPALAAEFLILGHTPEAWEPWQSVLVIKVMGLTLSSNMDAELTRFALARNGFKSSEIDDLIPYGPRDNPPPLPDLLRLYGLDAIEAAQAEPDDDTKTVAGLGFDLLTGQSASNNWVISGARTDTGKPILANDPHLGLTAPSTFHLAHMSWKDDGEVRHVIGGMVPGTPFVVVGRTDRVAWGLTTTNLDAQDLFLEQLDLSNNTYRTEDGWEPLSERSISVIAGGETVREATVISTRHGPLLPRGYRGISEFLPENFGFALSWPGLADDDTTLDALYLNNLSQSLNDFMIAGRKTISPMQSIVAADVKGNIGLAAIARTPKRKPENLVKGRAPVPGWLSEYQWAGFASLPEMLEIRNPAEQAITTANANFLPEDFEGHITYDWAEHFRQARAEELVMRRSEPHTVQASKSIIADTYSIAMVRLRDVALRIMRDSAGSHSEVRNVLAAWDGKMEREKPEPLIMLAWFRHLNIQMIQDDTGNLFPRFERGRITPLLGMLETSGARDWCDNKTTSETEDCADVLDSSLAAAMEELGKEFGAEWRTWRYGDAHLAYNEHRPFGQIGALADYFNIEVPTSGGPYTLLRAQTRFQQEKPYRSRHGAAYRAVYDLSDVNKSVFIQSTGQSGNFMSPYYDNFSERWADVEFLPMTTDREEYSAEAIGTWTFNPR